MMAASKQTALRGEMRIQEPMSKHTSWRVGGYADRFYIPADLEDLSSLLASLPADEPVFWLGLGSNILVRDGGIRGTVIAQKGSLAELDLIDTNRVLAGVFFAGIPGLLGGALAMNAGAFGGETWQYVESVTTIDRQGRLYIHTPDDYSIGYRSVKGPEGQWFVSAQLKFETGDGEQAAARIRELLDRRAQTQPVGLPSCGSVFRNPPGDHAARLIESAGLKGVARGDAVVSEKHANFIINNGQARASEIEELIEYVRQQVKQKYGVELKSEVRIVGEPA